MTNQAAHLIDRLIELADGREKDHAILARLPQLGLPETVEIRGAGDFPPDYFCHCRAGAWLQPLAWAPDDLTPTMPTWCVLALNQGGGQASVLIEVAPREWRWVPPEDWPWLIASSAGGLRASLNEGEPVIVKSAGAGADPRLYDAASRSNPPAIDEHGRL